MPLRSRWLQQLVIVIVLVIVIDENPIIADCIFRPVR
jgi:hypothetical protein